MYSAHKASELLKPSIHITVADETLTMIEALSDAAADTLSRQMIGCLVQHQAFSDDEKKSVRASLQRKSLDRKKIRYGYDVEVSFNAEGHNDRNILLEDVIHIHSKNFGYDFALVKVATGTTLFGLKKHAVQIYRSKFNKDEYTFIQTTSNLAKALDSIDKMYCQAADLHFP